MTLSPARPRHSAARTRARVPMRLDIQGLRALAVVLVVVYHLWPWRLSGGYVGVDVFFVISGFLITSHLVREAQATGGVRLGAFWARRARRLLPASLVVLGATLAAVWAWVPRALWEPFTREVIASAAYVENWVLASKAVDYLAADDAPSPVQHYWSLAAEEQFYLVWPLIVVAALVAARAGRGRFAPRRAIAAAVLAVTVASFVASVAWTAASPAQAYFITPTRAWEFGVGALLAFASAARAPGWVRAAAAWTGLAAIVAAAVAFDAPTPFPGSWALVPVLGTALVLWADGDAVRGTPGRLWRNRAVRATGELSYSIYLWHWVAIVIVPYAIGREMVAIDKLALLGGVAAASYLTWRWVESPVRRMPALAEAPARRTFAAVVVGMVLVIGPAAWMAVTVERDVAASLAESERLAAAAAIAGDPAAVRDDEDVAGDDAAVDELPADEPVEEPVCLGAATVDPEGACAPTLPEDQVVPLPAAAKADSPEDCLGKKGSRDFDLCEFGVPREEATETVALIGDSHAYHWLPALEALAERNGWHGIVMARASCPFVAEDRNLEERIISTCATFNERVSAELAEREDVTVVVMAALAKTRFAAPEGADAWGFAVDAHATAIEGLPDHVTDVYVMRDSPRPREDNVECVERELGSRSADGAGRACGTPRDVSVEDDALAAAAQAGDRAAVVDLTDLYCDADTCVPVVGNVLVYADQGHLTRTWVNSTVPQLERLMPAFSART
ncbi:acyltransferase family protein [Demequina sp. SYSU T00192]|uniref:Acyltransferase family protein n=1 Tax=Demequina litoralis TaxID=3051660 RepID=A0ABT8G7N6_9MICO|nr:acyltransferase family protein [Demequina sp. SYSU T00192]MDN4475168.1 acyltransferase family protein [Demequina sp. SYSU T00192]